MKLESLILVNWGSLRPGEYPMGNMTLLTGPTGSGKSTLLDALQTGMTAAYQNVFNYNPGQDETTQSARNGKTKRTLWSYIVGAEDNLFARPDGAHGYVALVFKPSEGETGNGFTALVAAAARVDGSGERRQAVAERLALLIIDDAALAFDDLVTLDDQGSMLIVSVEKVEAHLKAIYPKVNNFRDAKREYLCQLYGRFRGQKTVSFPEAEAAAKAWSQSIAHKPIGSVDELVKTQILEHDPQQLSQRISQISDLMRQIHNLRQEGERLRDNVARLEGLGASITDATDAYQKAVQYQVLAASRALKEDERSIETAKLALVELKEKIQAETDTAGAAEVDRQSVFDSLVTIEAKLSGIPAANQKAILDKQLEAAQQSVSTAIAELAQALTHVETLKTTATQLIALPIPPTFREIHAVVTAVAQHLAKISAYPVAEWKLRLLELGQKGNLAETGSVMAVVRDLENIGNRFDGLFQALAGTSDSLTSAVNGQLGALRSALEVATAREEATAARKQNLAEGGADYPRPVKVARDLFISDLPGVKVQVLCDLVEPVSEEWQAAIEGYMGKARFNFVVAPENEARAVEFVRQRHLAVSVIQGSLCLKNAKPERVANDSIIHELITEHPIAKAYLVEQFGNVVKVNSLEELRYTSRGVMKDGKAAGSRAMYNAGADYLVFGKAQQEQARLRAADEHAQAERELNTLTTQRQGLIALLGLAKGVVLPSFASTQTAERAVGELELGWNALKLLDLTQVDELEGQKKLLTTQAAGFSDTIKRANQKIGEYCSALATQQQLVNLKEGALPARRQRLTEELLNLKKMCEMNAGLSYVEMERQVTELLESGGAPLNLQESIQGLLLKAGSFTSDVREEVGVYNQSARSDERLEFPYGDHRESNFAPVYGLLVRLHFRVREQLKIQREIGLYRNLDQLRQAEESFRDVFTKQFCYEIRNSVDTGVKTLKALNYELDKLKFGTDRFRIDWSGWVSEFEEYYKFFSAAYELAETRESGGLFDEEALSPDNCKVRDRLLALLLSDDQERALKELQRIADYRNYRRYEIWKESDSGSRVALSEWGTGSGGQLETPAYIVRAAVVTNRLKHFDKGTNLKLLVNDESFAKMDERRAHDVMRFIRDSLGMQLICAMPTKHAGAIKSEFTKEWCFTRTEAQGNGEVDFVSEADERELNTDRLRELWETRRTEVRLQAQLLFEASEAGEPA